MKSHDPSADDARLLIEEKDKRYHKRHLGSTGARTAVTATTRYAHRQQPARPDGTAALIEEVARKVFNS